MKKILLLMLLFTGFVNAQIINFPDANFKATLLNASATNSIASGADNISTTIDTNGDGEIQVSEALLIYRLDVRNSFISDLSGIENFTNINQLFCDYNDLTSLNTSSLNNLVSLSCSNNEITTLNLTNSTLLEQLICNNNNLTSLNVSTLLSLESIYCSNNSLAALNVNTLSGLQILDCGGNPITTLDVTNLSNLINLKCNSTSLTALNVSPLINLESLEFTNCNISSIDVSALVNLKNLSCGSNGITALNISTLINLETLFVYNNQLTTLDLTGLTNLQDLNCATNLLTNLDVNFLTNLTHLVYGNENLANVDISNLVNLNSYGYYSGTELPAVLENFEFLEELSIVGTNISDLDVSNLAHLKVFVANGNTILNSINLKNGGQFDDGQIVFVNNANLTFVCTNEVDIQNATDGILLGNGAIVINSYCSFTPGGDYNTITGTMLFDANNNGCDALDLPQPNIKMTINDGTNQGATFTNNTGNYTFFTEAGNFNITLDVENPTWFNFSPTSATIPFANDDNNLVTQNFCIAANGVHPDLEIVIAPITPARPGFDAVYQIVYKNKGNQTLSQLYGITFAYNHNLMDFVSSSVTVSSSGLGGLTWDYANLLPFESRSIYVTMNINTPTDTTNPVNIGDLLQFTTSILPMAGDESTSDNTFVYNQIVVGSFDPNNIICVEGNVVPPSEIGDFLHYVINFENTGTAEAENIVVKTEVNANDFDITSLQMLNTSHNAYVRIIDNKIEFIFQNIMLDTGGHGNVLLKIRSKSSLVTGDMVSKRADIFFDYNFPIDTGMANTTFQALLSNPDFSVDNSIVVYPNPARNTININADTTINSIQMYDIQGRLLFTKIENQSEVTLDISDKSNGIYFLKILSDKGIKVEKIVKE